jgi:hypothetical protein
MKNRKLTVGTRVVVQTFSGNMQSGVVVAKYRGGYDVHLDSVVMILGKKSAYYAASNWQVAVE